MTRRWAVGLATAALVGLLSACNNSSSDGPSVSARATGLEQTAEALLTSTAAASITPETPTPEPSATTAATATAATPTPAAVTATPVPSATATPCPNDDAAFVSDVNVPDGSHFKPGAAFTKTWRLRNSGQCVWTTAYTLRNVGGELMGGATINLPNGVPPGATIDLTVSFVAPNNPGKHISHWQMFTPEGAGFGTQPFVQIAVP